VEAGLLDNTGNGLYGDSGDLVYMDQNGDGNFLESEESYRPGDIFRLKKGNYKITGVDKYGRWLEVVKTSEKPTPFYLNVENIEVKEDRLIGKIDESVWDFTAPAAEGGEIGLKSYKGRLLLLNFWAEYCMGCRMEIPVLKEAHEKRKLQVVGVLAYRDLETARSYIREQGIAWPNMLVSDSLLAAGFRIYGYPVNLFILPDGRTCIKNVGMFNSAFIESVVARGQAEAVSVMTMLAAPKNTPSSPFMAYSTGIPQG
jgi:thiol-disulfide isomerase/thioredoxin